MPEFSNEPRRLSIVHMIPQDAVGGVETAARSMLDAVLPCDFTLVLIAGPTLAPRHDKVIESPFRSPLNPFAQLRALYTVLRLDPDFLVCSLWRSILPCIFIKLLRPRLRLAFFLHIERPMHLLDAVLSRLALWTADIALADSPATLSGQRLPARTPGRVISFVLEHLAPYGPHPALASPTFVVWARLSRQKGTDRALRLIAALARRGIEAKFEIWGPDGGDRGMLEAQAQALGIETHVIFKGPAAREALPEIAARHNFFLQLSRAEGMAMGVVEAMQLGLIPVVTPVGQIAHYVRPAETGILVNPNDLESAASQLAALLDDQVALQQLRHNAITSWIAAPLYAEDVCRAAAETCQEGPAGALKTGRSF